MSEGEEICHCCEAVTECWECPSCGKPTCEDCFTPMCSLATDPVTNCKDCDHRFEMDRWVEERREREFKEERRRLDFFKCLRRSAILKSPVIQALEVSSDNFEEVALTLLPTHHNNLLILIDHNFYGEPYFRIRFKEWPNLDPFTDHE